MPYTPFDASDEVNTQRSSKQRIIDIPVELNKRVAVHEVTKGLISLAMEAGLSPSDALLFAVPKIRWTNLRERSFKRFASRWMKELLFARWDVQVRSLNQVDRVFSFVTSETSPLNEEAINEIVSKFNRIQESDEPGRMEFKYAVLLSLTFHVREDHTVWRQ
eukprot:6214847-Pleurochrysis_carterae.AAC.12